MDIYQRGDGQTTLRPTSSNSENAIKLKEAVELRGYKSTSEQKQFTMFVGEDWIEKPFNIYLVYVTVMLKSIKTRDMHDMYL